MVKSRIQQNKQVALIIETSNEYARSLLHGIRKYIRENRQWSIYFREHERGNEDLTWLMNWNGDGILARIENKHIAEFIFNKNLPTVDLSSFRLLPHIPYVETNDKQYAKLAADHLLSRQFKNFAYCGNSKYNWSIQRGQYFKEFIQQKKFPFYSFDSYTQSDSFDSRMEMVKWVKSLPKPIGIMACFDNQGQELLEACRLSGVLVPYEVAVIGCDNDELICDLSEPSLSSIIPNTIKSGYQAALLLEKLMNGESCESLEYLIDPIGIKTRQSSDIFAISDKLVSKALYFIHRNACNGINVEDVLNQIPLSRRVFENRFKQIVGKSPHREILDVKLEFAKRLLEETDLTLDEISSRSGFNHSEYLSVVFKRETTLLPSEYRKLNKSMDTPQ